MTNNTPQDTLIGHLTELRKRVVRSLLAIGLGAVVGLVFCKQLYRILQVPMLKALPEGSFFIATTPFESYITYFKVSLLAGLFVASPFVFYQLWRFVAPGLEPREKKYLLPASFVSALLFTGGALFGYFVVFPAGFYYVSLVMNDTAIRLLPKMSDYLGLSVMMLLAFGITFELPLFIFIAGKLGLIDYGFIKRNRRYVIVALFVLAAILTPGPDVLSQLLLALPLWALFEVGGLTLLMIRH
ncbi:MAG: twin-arginine translocase subunit TatC [Deltaproteobacteria bacterium]|nr:twin-arginine translocase subunit TatC [Deltaproteobacteria bacterium]